MNNTSFKRRFGSCFGDVSGHVRSGDVSGHVSTAIWILFAVILLFSGCTKKPEEVVIIYTNDTHTNINNIKKEKDGTALRQLSYASVAALKDDLAAEGKNVILVDNGDHIQGTAFGDADYGKTIIQIMNKTGYQLATPGNHEFDFRVKRFLEVEKEAAFPYISCNFYSEKDKKLILPPYKIIQAGNMKIAFVGISTPETITKSNPTFFADESGELLYNFYAGENGEELYKAVQAAIDEAKTQADYVIALGHVGIDAFSAPYRSRNIIEHTTGLTAFIDGHSHTKMEREEITDASGKKVVLTQTGSYLKAIGKMTIAPDGTVTTQLIEDYPKRNQEVAAMEDAWIKSIEEKLGTKIAVLDSPMYIMDPKIPEHRIVRNQETNLGDLMADSYYYYLNETMDLKCDVAFANGGSVRSRIDAGDLSYLTAKTVAPFGNVLCMMEMSGQTLLDALEKGAMPIGLLTETTKNPAESGGFMQVAGMTYEIDSSVKTTVITDEHGTWLGSPTGTYKVKNVKIYDRTDGIYKPLDLNKRYRVGSISYTIRDMGDGMAMFKSNELIVDYLSEDYVVIANYFAAFAKGSDGFPHVTTENSPLKKYPNYLINYEDPYGSGRITIK